MTFGKFRFVKEAVAADLNNTPSKTSRKSRKIFYFTFRYFGWGCFHQTNPPGF
jgi:hypothetical protein